MATTRKRPQSPKPITVTTVCSECGLGWELHGKDPTTDDCIRLLKAELARRPYVQPIRPIGYPQPYPVPYPYPHPTPYRPWVSTPYTITCQSGGGTAPAQTFNYKTPRTIEATCHAVSN